MLRFALPDAWIRCDIFVARTWSSTMLAGQKFKQINERILTATSRLHISLLLVASIGYFALPVWSRLTH